MCGINGIIYKRDRVSIHEISKMNMAINHRGPDDEGILAFENILLGHVRLSIQDLSKKGNQPMSVDGNLWIVFNGEIYNFKDLKLDLQNIGHKFYSNTDTEVILKAYTEWGYGAFEKFNGMWSFAILDKLKKKILICRDRYGVKPCYFANNNNKFIFSSEIKGILSSNEYYALDNNKILLSDKSKEKLFTTDYANIDIVQPGFFYEISLTNQSIKKNRWWSGLDNIPKISKNYKFIKEEFREKLIQATKIRLVSDTKIATSLSGGIDSSVIFSILNSFKFKNQADLNPFILKYDGMKTLDAAISLSKLNNKIPSIIEVNEHDTLTNLSKLLSSIEITTPFTKQYKLYQAQKKLGFRVSIDGHGADESLGGYANNIENFALYFQNNLANSYEAIIRSNGVERLKKSLKNYALADNLRKFKIDIDSQFTKPNINKNRYVEQIFEHEFPDSLYKDLKELKNFSFDFQILYLDTNYGHLQWLLNKWDKASMANSVEIRSPFLDWNVFQFCISLPAEYKIMDGVNKSILRDTFKDKLTNEINSTTIKQGLSSSKTNIDNQTKKIINETINEKEFKESHNWNGKKILKDFESKKINNDSINEIWHLTKIHLLNKGYDKRSKEAGVSKLKSSEKFNLLLG
jgi:asparagine synthase (glutamine-hydrolysing)